MRANNNRLSQANFLSKQPSLSKDNITSFSKKILISPMNQTQLIFEERKKKILEAQSKSLNKSSYLNPPINNNIK